MATLMFNGKQFASATTTSDEDNFRIVAHYNETHLLVKDPSTLSKTVMLIPRNSSMDYNVPEPNNFVWFSDDFNRPYRALIYIEHPFDKGSEGVFGISSGSGVYSLDDADHDAAMSSCIYAGKGWKAIRDRVLLARCEYIAWKQRQLIIKLQQFNEKHGGSTNDSTK